MKENQEVIEEDEEWKGSGSCGGMEVSGRGSSGVFDEDIEQDLRVRTKEMCRLVATTKE